MYHASIRSSRRRIVCSAAGVGSKFDRVVWVIGRYAFTHALLCVTLRYLAPLRGGAALFGCGFGALAAFPMRFISRNR